MSSRLFSTVLPTAVAMGLAAALVAQPGVAAAAKPIDRSFLMVFPTFYSISGREGVVEPEAIAQVDLRSATGEICLDLRTIEVGPPLTVHLHGGPNGQGPVLATFFESTEDTSPTGCAVVGGDVVRRVADNGFANQIDIHSPTIRSLDGNINGQVLPRHGAFLDPSPGGDQDGTGIVKFLSNDRPATIETFLNTEGLTPPLTVDLRSTATGTTVATLIDAATHADPYGSVAVDKQLAHDFHRSPESFTVVVTSADHPDGALAGDLAVYRSG